MSNAQSNPRRRTKAGSRSRTPAIVIQQDDGDDQNSKPWMLLLAPSWLVSFATHLALLLILGFWLLPVITDRKIAFESGTQSGDATESVELSTEEFDSESAAEELDTTEILSELNNEIAEPLEFESPTTDVADFGDLLAGESFEAAADPSDVSGGNALSARSADGRARAISEGATAESEESVDLALEWIVRHQLPDGGWNLDHTVGPGDFRDTEGAGTKTQARNGATALALLPLLGAGITHKSGKYRDAVGKGLEFLKRRGRARGSRTSYIDQDGELYSHGLVAIVFCEAYAMTQDSELYSYAQAAIAFTEYAQDTRGGGWRYAPRQRGDTSAVGWQIAALKSAKISGLETNPRTFKRANKFLDFVSNSDGSQYGYISSRQGEVRKSLNAVGLLSRMFLDWPKDRPGLVRGMQAIANEGPDTTDSIDLYYNYYATQAMKHMYIGTSTWTRWNTEMRDFLVSVQDRDGDTRGSWYFDSHWSQSGGRLYCTAMSCMTLEVYYRFLPLYGKSATLLEEEFQLFKP